MKQMPHEMAEKWFKRVGGAMGVRLYFVVNSTDRACILQPAHPSRHD